MTMVMVGPRKAERNQLETTYITRDLELQNEGVKQVQRDRVLEHLKKFHPDPRMRLFSLPGAWWTFERQVEDNYPEAKFIAVEKNYELMRHGATFIPGLNLHRQSEELKDYTLEGYRTSKANILWCHASLFTTVKRKEKGGNKKQKRWLETYKKWTAVWWDFTSPINSETLECLLNTEIHLDESKDAIPVSITLFGAREDADYSKMLRTVVPVSESAAHKRAEFIRLWVNHHCTLREMEIVEVFPYLSVAGAPMILLNTLFRNKRPSSSVG